MNILDLPDDALLRLGSLLSVGDRSALAHAHARFGDLFPYYACAACDHPLFSLAGLRPPPLHLALADYLHPCAAELAETTVPLAEHVHEHHATRHPRSACAKCGAFVALLLDGPQAAAVHCVYRRDAVLVLPSSAPGAGFCPLLKAEETSVCDLFECATCNHRVAHGDQLRQRLSWVDAGYAEEVLAFTRLLPFGGAVDAAEDTLLPTAQVGNWAFLLRHVRCFGCESQLGWQLAGLEQDAREGDDFGERCPVAPELVGRFLLVREALSEQSPTMESPCIVDLDCVQPVALPVPAPSLVV
jgi:hypothetical protein